MKRMQQNLRLATITAAFVLAVLLAGGFANSALASGNNGHGSGDHGDSAWSNADSDSHNNSQVPELDPGSAGLAIALVAGGLAILRDRCRRRS
jgi:hypothetical protein